MKSWIRNYSIIHFYFSGNIRSKYMKTFILLFLCAVLSTMPAQAQTRKGGFLSKGLDEDYNARTSLQAQRRIMEINLSINKIRKELEAVKARGVTEKDADFLAAKEKELERLAEEINAISKEREYALRDIKEKGHKNAMTGERVDESGKSAGKTVRRDFSGGYSLVTKNSDGSVSTVNHLTCASCGGSGTCRMCGGTAVSDITRTMCPCVTGKCGICHGAGERVTTSVYYPGVGMTITTTTTDGSMRISGPGLDNPAGPGRNDRNDEKEDRGGRYGQIDCHSCWGSGVCATCHGEGYFYFGSSTVLCPNCDHDHNGRCGICHGKGTVYGIKDFSKDY